MDLLSPQCFTDRQILFLCSCEANEGAPLRLPYPNCAPSLSYAYAIKAHSSREFQGYHAVVNDAISIFSHRRRESVRALRKSFEYLSLTKYWRNANLILFPPALSKSFSFLAGSLVVEWLFVVFLCHGFVGIYPQFSNVILEFLFGAFSALFSPPLLCIFGMPHWWRILGLLFFLTVLGERSMGCLGSWESPIPLGGECLC